jgi:hypothetical protein
MQNIIHEHVKQAISKNALNFESIIPAWSIKGYTLLPGLTKWYPKLNPFNRKDAWRDLQDSAVSTTLHTNPAQQEHFLLNDGGSLDDEPSLSIQFKEKPGKAHLTIIDGSEKIDLDPGLPRALQSYLADCREFMELAEEYLLELLPAATLPTRLVLRIFSYHSTAQKLAMKPHVDGSIGTIIVAKSDGLLHFQNKNQWCAARRFDEKPFALLMPGIAAWHDIGIPPTPHYVLPCATPRSSITLFLTPRFSGQRTLAEAELSRWRRANITINT